jgi:hypothetical protein
MDARQTAANDQAQRFLAAVEDAMAPAMPTSYRDDSPVPTVGPTPPVADSPAHDGPR